jgi:TolB-like protein
MRPLFPSGLLAGVIAAAVVLPAAARAEKEPAVYPLAILEFAERGADVKGLGAQVTDLLFAELATAPEMYLVDREDLEKSLKELELNLSGAVNPSEATQVGQLTGAKILVAGSVLQVDGKLYLVAKIIGTETSRVLGASAKGDVGDRLDDLVERLAEQVSKTIRGRAEELVATPDTREDRLAALKKALGKKDRPVLRIEVSERHVGQATIDPAAETELARLCTELGFEVYDPDTRGARKAEILLVGDGFSEFAARHGNLVSDKARLEIKAIEATSGRLLAVDRQTAVEVDLTEQIAGKAALQEAAADIAERMLPKLVGAKSEKKAAPK